jgi:hypothetical protein
MNVLRVKAWHHYDLKMELTYRSMFWAPYVSVFQSYVSRVDCAWNVMANSQKQRFVFQRDGWVHLNWRGRRFSRLLEAEVCSSAVVMLDTACSEVVWRVLSTLVIRQFPLQFLCLSSPCAITFQWALPLSRTGQSRVPTGTKNISQLLFVIC